MLEKSRTSTGKQKRICMKIVTIKPEVKKNMEIYVQSKGSRNQSTSNLAVDGESRCGGGVGEEVNLSIAAADKTVKDLTTSVNPLGELLGGYGVWVLTVVEASNEGGVGDSSNAHVEGPGDEGTVLVGVEFDFINESVG